MSPHSRRNGRLAKQIRFVLRRVLPLLYDFMDVWTECKGIVIHDKVPTVDLDTLHRCYAVDAFG